MTYAYIRVSSDRQTTKNQYFEISSYAENRGMKIDEWVDETVSSRKALGDNINSKVLAFAFGLSAEIERNLISQRTKEALARRKAEGQQRKKAETLRKGGADRALYQRRHEQVGNLPQAQRVQQDALDIFG